MARKAAPQVGKARHHHRHVRIGGVKPACRDSYVRRGPGPPLRVESITLTLNGFTLSSLEAPLPRGSHRLSWQNTSARRYPGGPAVGSAGSTNRMPKQAGHDTLTRQLLNEGRGIRLKALFRMTEYPRDMTLLNAQGHSVCRFLLAEGHSHAALLGICRE